MAAPRYLETGTRRARAGNGAPAGGGYLHPDTARALEIAAVVAAARARADGLPGALPRCGSCGLPAAECADTRCLTVCPEHQGTLLLRTRKGLLACSTYRRVCAYEIARGDAPWVLRSRGDGTQDDK